jgi:RNA polymerase sigma factor (sigma-70 family)
MVQDVLLQVVRRLDTFEHSRAASLQAYLRVAVANRIRDEVRRYRIRGPAEASEWVEDQTSAMPSPLEAAIGTEALERYEAALQRLSDRDRALLISRIELQSSYAEIATQFDLSSTDAARKSVARALHRLATTMATPPTGR